MPEDNKVNNGSQAVEDTDHSWLELGLPESEAREAAGGDANNAGEHTPNDKTGEADPEPKAGEGEVDPPATGAGAPKTGDDPTSQGKDGDYVKTLHEKLSRLESATATLIEENAKLLAAQNAERERANQPKPEELEAQAAARRNEFLTNPDAFLKQREDEIRKKATEDAAASAKEQLAKSMGFDSVEKFESWSAASQGLKTLEADDKSYPLMKDEAFKKVLGDPETLKPIFKLFPPDSRPNEVLKSPQFWALAYQQAALKTVASATRQPTGSDKVDTPLNPVNPSPAPAAKGAPVPLIDEEWAAVEKAGESVFK